MLTWEDLEVLSHEPLTRDQIISRDIEAVPFERDKILIAMMKAFLAVRSSQDSNVVLAEHWLLSDLFRHWARHLASLNLLIMPAFIKPMIKFSKTPPVKLRGFFSSSKVNLRNAP